MATVKISELTSSLVSEIKAGSLARGGANGIVIPVLQNTVTRGLKIDDFFAAAANITSSGHISASGDLFVASASVNHIKGPTKGDFQVQCDTVTINPTSVLPNVPSIQLAGSTDISGSTSVSGSVEISGSFNVNNLLNLLANYGSTGIPTGSDALGPDGGISQGDINFDGQVNVNDMMLVLAGYGNPNIVIVNSVIPPNVNHQYIGPTLSISSSVTLSISTGSFCSITL